MWQRRCSSFIEGLTQWFRIPVLALFILAVIALPQAQAFTLHVVDGATGVEITNQFRWMVEVDNTWEVVPQDPVTDALGFQIHNSYAPVAALMTSGQPAKGDNASSGVAIDVDPAGRYFVSVLPNLPRDGIDAKAYSSSGIPVAANQGSATVFVTSQPLPTAQISVYAFMDVYPINNAPDDPLEPGLGGATIIISDAAGPLWQDAWGNPLGTTYVLNNGVYELDVDGVPVVLNMGNGVLTTISAADVNDPIKNPYGLAVGEQQIKFLPPGKYGIVLIPPNDGKNYQLTSTIEGTPTVDAWVQADESPRFIEQFGVSFYHTFFGFVVPEELPWAVTPPTGGGSIAGQNRFNHFSRPPNNQGFFAGPPVDQCWFGVNDAVTGEGLYAAACDNNSMISVTGMPDGQYELVTWDTPLDALFGFHPINIPELGADGQPITPENRAISRDFLSFRWFGTAKGSVFLDVNENGYRDAEDVVGIQDQAVNLRFRDGTLYQGTVTGLDGDWELSEVFPFFKWLTLEVDFARFKATGMTMIVDQGGPVDPADLTALGIDFSLWDPRALNTLNPQGQFDPATVTVDATGQFTGTPIINPETGNNLSRTVTDVGAVTMAQQLYLNQTNIVDWGKAQYGPGVDGIFGTIDDENGGVSGVVFYAVTRAEDDPRWAAAEDWEPGLPNVQVVLYHDDVAPFGKIDCLDNTTGDPLPPLQQTSCVPELADTDNAPLGDFPGVGDVDLNSNGSFDAGDAVSIAWTDSWNDSKPTDCIQVLPTIHGGTPPRCGDTYGTWNQLRDGIFDGGFAFFDHYERGVAIGEPAGDTPIGLQSGNYIVEAKTPFGLELLKEEDKNVDYGDSYIPSLNQLAPICVGDDRVVPDFLSLFGDIPAPFAGQVRPLCDRKKVDVKANINAAAEFFFFTPVPKAARGVGFINNDLSAEFNDASPAFGEKGSPSWLPVSFRDWAGNEVSRVVSDEFGHYEALLPASYTVNQASPTGVTLAMHNILINDPFMQDPGNPTGPRIPDPNYDPNISVTPWVFQFESGRSSYIDSPVVPTAAFVGYPTTGLDIEAATGTPVIDSVAGLTGGALVCAENEVLTLNSMGTVSVPNPDYDPNTVGSLPTIDRDFGFGTVAGTVTLNGTALNITSWTDSTITAEVPLGVTSGQLVVTRSSGVSNELSVSVLVGDCGAEVYVNAATGSDANDGSAGAPYATIQKGIDSAPVGGRVIVAAGLYNESVLLYKELTLQGAGEGTVIDARANPPSIITQWNAAVAGLGAGPFTANEMPAIMVIGDTSVTALPTGVFSGTTPDDFDFASGGVHAKIDGFTLTGATAGGGISVISHAYDLEISNNRINGNQGTYAGGIGIGIPDTANVGNFNIYIHDNQILKNAGVDGGGGVALYSGTDNYRIENNTIKGNLTRFHGGGISHYGLSNGGLIYNNTIAFNEAFFGAPGAFAGDGGGIFIGSEVVGGGSGNVTVNANLIQGNLSGAGNGGGIRLDGTDNFDIAIYNNMIVNNVAGLAGGGISLQDAQAVDITNNTIAHNDSTATALAAFPLGIVAPSAPTPAGIVANVNAGGVGFSNPILVNNIVYQNRSFLYDPSLNAGQGGLTFSSYWDYAVTGVAGVLAPTYNLMTDLTGYNDGTNVAGDPSFRLSYFNDLATAAVIDEGGNAITVRYTALDIANGNYHILQSSVAIDAGVAVTATELAVDIDSDARIAPVDIGADEVLPISVTLTETSGAAFATFDYTAQASGGTAPYEYRFFLFDPAVGWSAVGGTVYSGVNTWTWDASGAADGTYYIRVWARSQGSTAPFEVFDTVTHVIAPLSVALTETAGATEGTFDYTAVSTDGFAPYEYRFFLFDPAVGWSAVGGTAYSATDTWTWDARGAAPGTYYVRVWARSQGSTSPFEALATVTHVITPLAVTLTEGGGTVAGTFDYTAAAAGGVAPYEYRFFLFDPAVGWSAVGGTAYSAANTWTWDANAAAPGTYYIRVWARGQGSTAPFEDFDTVTHVITP